MPLKKSLLKEQKLSELRKRAEAILAAGDGGVSNLEPEAVSNILHELHTYQIELELQNEELRLTQIELTRSQKRYVDLYDFAPAGYVTVNEKGLIVEANITAADMLSIARGHLIRQPLSKFIVDEDQDVYYTYRRKAMETGKRQACELRMRRNDGAVFWVKVECTPTEAAPKTGVQLRTIISDITERKQAAEVLQKSHAEVEQRVKKRTIELELTNDQLVHADKLAAIGRLAASIAHEVNNPLFGIRNVLAGIKKRTPLNEADAELVDMSLQECDRIKQLIHNLQDFNRPSSGVMAPMDVHKTIDSVLLLLKKELQNKKIKVKKDLAVNLPHIMAVSDQIKQVLLNLLNNATDAMQDSKGTITITTHLCKDTVTISIQDTGLGIQPETMKHIFEPFFTTKPAVKGTGLGLSVSYGIVTRHGGRFKVKSEPGKGSIFTILLPVSAPEKENHLPG